MEMMKRDNKEVAQDGVKSTASQLQGERLAGEVDEAAWTCYERVKGMILYLLYSVSVGMKTVLSNPSNKEIYERIETNESNKLFSSNGENNSEEEEASVSVSMKSVLPNPPNKEIHERIETTKSNKFNSSGGENKSEEEDASKGQESRAINTNSSSSNGKAKNGECVLNRPPKKPGGGEVYENNTATTMSCETVLEQENSCKTISDLLEKMEIPDIVQMEKETNQDKKWPLR